jgi:hypothetical protein
MLKTKTALLILGFMGWGCSKPPAEPMEESTTSKYHPGEEYSFGGRPGDDQPRFLVLRVDHHKKMGNIVHLTITGIHLKNPKAPSGYFDKIAHFPIAEISLDKSDPKLLRSGAPLPDFKSAYQEWRMPFDEGKAGIWSNPLALCLQSMERAANP